MPYVVRKSGSQYCLYKKEGGKLKRLKGGCHASRSKAIKQRQAIYISEHGLSNKK